MKRVLILNPILLPILLVTLFVDNWRWEGVPFNVMTGKKMPYGCVEVVIKLKAPPQQLFEGEYNDRIVMRLQPRPHLDIRIDMKVSRIW